MVRTQQSGRKSTGGTGVRKQLPPRAARTAALLKTVPEPESDSESDASMRSPPSSPPATTTISTAKPADSQVRYYLIWYIIILIDSLLSNVIRALMADYSMSAINALASFALSVWNSPPKISAPSSSFAPHVTMSGAVPEISQ